MSGGTKKKPDYQMEDTHVIVEALDGNPDMALFGVFDGHVDKNAAEAAVALFPKEFQRIYAEEKDVGKALYQSFIEVDKLLGEFVYEGTTATVAILHKTDSKRTLYVANVGDSTAFLCRNGNAVQVSEEHKVTDPVETKRLKALGLEFSTRLNGMAISRALGDHFMKQTPGLIGEPFLLDPIELESDDLFLIVASDGLWDTMTGQEAVDRVIEYEDAGKMARELVKTALDSKKCTDNITVIVVAL